MREFIYWVLGILKRCKSPSLTTPPPTELTIPHPEEPFNPNATTENVNVGDVVRAWLTDWKVPCWDFWLSVDVKLSDKPRVAYTYSHSRKMRVRPGWANPGVFAHEHAHISYALLADTSDFKEAFERAILDDELLKCLYSQRWYIRTNLIEGHADTYRFLGEKMPENLKQFYPKLF